MIPLSHLTSLRENLINVGQGDPQKKIYLKVKGTDTNRHVVVVTGFFSLIWARIASAFGRSSYKATSISDALLTNLQELKKNINNISDIDKLTHITTEVTDLFTDFCTQKRFATEFIDSDSKAKLTSIHTSVDEILTSVNAISQTANQSLEEGQVRARPTEQEDGRRAIVPWSRLAKVEKSRDLVPRALREHRQFLSLILGQPVEQVCGKKVGSERAAFYTIRAKIENKLEAMEKTVERTVSGLLAQGGERSLFQAVYQKTQRALHERVVALKESRNDTDWSAALSRLQPVVEKYESLASAASPLVLEYALHEMWEEVGEFWKKTSADNPSKWRWQRTAIPKNIDQEIAVARAEKGVDKNFDALLESISAAERAGMKIGSKVEELRKLKEAHHAKASPSASRAVSIRAQTSFDAAFDEVSEYLELNIRGTFDARSAINQKFNEYHERLSLDPLFKSRGTMSYQLLETICDNCTRSSERIRTGNLSPLEEKKELYRMMQLLCELKLLNESTKHPVERVACLAKTILLLRTVLENIEIDRMHYPEDIFALLPLSSAPPHSIDMVKLARLEGQKMRKISELVGTCLDKLNPILVPWTRELCEKLFNENHEWIEDGQAASDEVKLAFLELQLLEKQKIAPRGTLEGMLIDSSLTEIQALQLPKNMREEDALIELFSLAEKRKILLQKMETIVKKDAREYGEILFKTFVKKWAISPVPAIDFQNQERSQILQLCRSCYRTRSDIAPADILELEKILRRITKK